MSEQQQQEQERYEMAVEALSRCARAGAKKEDIETLCREVGVDPKFVATGGME